MKILICLLCLASSRPTEIGWLPNVLMEAASKKVCCIATDLPGITEFIRHDDTGWIVPSKIHGN
ncbi:MAG: hypothetical protein CM15mP62_05120 [Rhodospirillaceae bacterium]|nr:MAG: hypothetical protein CM15mP62_05120 [Rhodospirillaceae bacterium]